MLIGRIHYVDINVKDRNRQGRSKPAVIYPVTGGYQLQVEGFAAERLPAPTRDILRAVKRGKRWITANGGTCLKRPKS